LLLDNRIGHYDVTNPAIAQGLSADGLTNVTRATNREGQRVAMLRVPAPPRGPRAQDLQKLLGVRHPTLSALIDLVKHERQLYAVFDDMDVRGSTLRRLLASRKLTARRIVELGAEIAEAVADLQCLDLPAPEIVPETVMITPEGFVKVVPVSPVEWHQPAAPSLRSKIGTGWTADVFSIGALLFEMAHRTPPRLPLASAPSGDRTNAPETGELDTVVAKALAESPDARFGSAASLAAELRALAAILDLRIVGADASASRSSSGRSS
jgi:hypothetical protein